MRRMPRQHTIEVLLRGALMRGERRRAADLLKQFKELLAVTDSAADAAWQPEMELMLQVRPRRPVLGLSAHPQPQCLQSIAPTPLSRPRSDFAPQSSSQAITRPGSPSAQPHPHLEPAPAEGPS